MKESVGQPKNRLDGKLKVTGKAMYSGDYKVSKLVHAVPFQSTIASGKIQDFDLREAKRVPGVIEIITFENSQKLKKPKATPGSGPGESFLPLQDNKVFYNGQYIGVVLAESLEAAEQAARLVKVTYHADKAKLDLDRMEEDSKKIKMMAGIGPISSSRGNVDKAFKKADVRFEQTYTTPIENHNPMEPSAILANWNSGEMRIYDATQGVTSSAKLMSQVFERPIEQTEVITKFIGGGFGCKGSMWPHQAIAMMASKQISRPVRLVLSREQMFTGVGHRARTIQKVSMGMSKSGRLESMKHVVYNNTAVNKDFSERSAVPTQMLYSCENLTAEHRLSKRNYQVPTFMRAPGESSGSFAIESSMDEVAEILKMDPIEFRIRNHADKDEHEKKEFSSKSLKQCYAQAAEKFNWKRRHSEPKKVKDGDWYVGYGMATATYPANIFPAKAKVALSDDGTAKVTSSTQDIGTGTYTVMTQVAADELGLAYDKVVFDLGDSKFPDASVSGGSTTASSVGSAIKKGCKDVQEKLKKLAIADPHSPLHGATEEDIIFGDGQLKMKSFPEKTESMSELMKRNKIPSIVSEGEMGMKEAMIKKFSSHSFGAQFVEVRVHSLTGEVRISKWVGAFAAGKILNPKTAKSQFMGGIIFGIGMGLMEATTADPNTGRLTVKDLADYHVPISADVPELEIIMVDEKDTEVNPLGTKGIGEVGIVGAAAAIANAVYNATGVRVRDLPLTPDKILRGLQNQKV